MPASTVRELTRQWVGHLAHYRRHRNDEHIEALVDETRRYAGLHLENDLSASEYWSSAPLGRRVAVLLFLHDRGVITRDSLHGRHVFTPSADAESWASAQPALFPYLTPILELLAAVRRVSARRAHPKRP